MQIIAPIVTGCTIAYFAFWLNKRSRK
nr:type I toxin-antitoxin system Fst family toxin [Staphylococcus sp. MI 10-1553]